MGDAVEGIFRWIDRFAVLKFEVGAKKLDTEPEEVTFLFIVAGDNLHDLRSDICVSNQMIGFLR